MIYVTRKVQFSAGHRLYNPLFNEDQNKKIFGKCSNPNGHGHNYELEVTVAGNMDPDTGMVIDLKILKQIIHVNIINKVDHRNLNMDVDFMKDVIPTTENLAKRIWKELERHIPRGKLFSVRIYESSNNFVEYKGEETLK